MTCRTLPREMRQKVVDEAGSVCACAATRHLDSFTGTGATLEVHHIEPFRLVHEHRFENLVALCPNCHRRADRGEITSWVLTQLKQTLKFRKEKPASRQSTIGTLLASYVDKRRRHTVIGEGYYTAAVFLDWVRTQQMKAAGLRAFLREILAGSSHPDLVLADLYLEVDRCDEAVRVLQRSDLRKARDVKYASHRGLAADRAGQYQSALWWFSLQERLDKPSVTLCNNMGDCLIYLGQSATVPRKRRMYFSRALDAFNRAPGTSPALHFNKGRLLALMGQDDDAMMEFRKAIISGPQFPLPHIFLADLLAGKSQLEESVAHYREGLSRRPRRLEFLIRASDVARRSGMQREAWEFLAAYETKQPYMPSGEKVRLVSRKKNVMRWMSLRDK
jgi:tetratricopeptide (TPR) repeat protein